MSVPSKAEPRWRTRSVIAITGLWAVAVVIGLGMLFSYKNTAGAAASAGQTWPTNSQLRLDPQLPTLIMFAHPKCTCTRASMSELSALMTEMRGKVVGRVIFMKPSEFDDDWEKTDTWQTAQTIPGVSVSTDLDGREGTHFGVRTSGQVLLFSPARQLLYAGGITSSRGHPGDNAGRQRIEALLSDRPVDQRTSPVFGCSLTGDEPPSSPNDRPSI